MSIHQKLAEDGYRRRAQELISQAQNLSGRVAAYAQNVRGVMELAPEEDIPDFLMMLHAVTLEYNSVSPILLSEEELAIIQPMLEAAEG